MREVRVERQRVSLDNVSKQEEIIKVEINASFSFSIYVIAKWNQGWNSMRRDTASTKRVILNGAKFSFFFFEIIFEKSFYTFHRVSLLNKLIEKKPTYCNY